MAMVEIKRQQFVTYTQTEPGATLVDGAYYQGTQEGQYGLQHVFMYADGQQVVLNKAGFLNKQLEKHHCIGKKVKIIFDGETGVIKKGPFAGKPAYGFRLFLDEADLIPTEVAKPDPFGKIKSSAKPATAESVGLKDYEDFVL